MEAILNKEKNKEKKERVSLVLVKKLSTKYGRYDNVSIYCRVVLDFQTKLNLFYSKYESLISFFVEEFFSSHDEIESHDLDILEKEIRNAIRAKIDAAELQRNAPPPQEERKMPSQQSSNPVSF
jgi:hypothetical protein